MLSELGELVDSARVLLLLLELGELALDKLDGELVDWPTVLLLLLLLLL